jgi:hypothetical protein
MLPDPIAWIASHSIDVLGTSCCIQSNFKSDDLDSSGTSIGTMELFISNTLPLFEIQSLRESYIRCRPHRKLNHLTECGGMPHDVVDCSLAVAVARC